jgi:dual specificity protein kinase YAK1
MHKLKFVDFGLARKDCKYEGSYIQSRYYRAPEVILGLHPTEAIDMWSLGCTLAELYLGIPLFAGNCNYSMLSLMSQVLG